MHQRTPGQILSLTSNIEFSPYLSYLGGDVGTSPDLSRNNKETVIAATTTTTSAAEKEFILKANSLANNKPSHAQHCHHICKQHRINYSNRNLKKHKRKSHHHHHHHQHHHKATCMHRNLKHINQEVFAANLRTRKNPNSTNLNMQVNGTCLSFNDMTDDGSDSVASISAAAISSSGQGKKRNVSGEISKSAAVPVDVFHQRRLTPLRWSKKLTRRRKSIFRNISNLQSQTCNTVADGIQKAANRKSSGVTLLQSNIKGKLFIIAT